MQRKLPPPSPLGVIKVIDSGDLFTYISGWSTITMEHIYHVIVWLNLYNPDSHCKYNKLYMFAVLQKESDSYEGSEGTFCR